MKGCGGEMEWYAEGYDSAEWKCGDTGRPLCPNCDPPPANFRVSADPINPSHYKKPGEPESIDRIRAELGPEGFSAYCAGNVLKYLYRAGHKGSAIEDMAKADWYAAWAEGRDPRESEEIPDCSASNKYFDPDAGY